MIYTIGKQKLKVPEYGDERKRRTPRQVVPWRDVAETCRTLDAVCSRIPSGPKPLKIVDGIARSGFWGAVFRERWPNCKLVLNEESQDCLPILKENFPKDEILSHDILGWTPKTSDIALLDFDHFTLRMLEEWKDVLVRFSPTCKHFIIADGACFGFKFGNMKHYQVETAEDYYRKLDEAMAEFQSKRITVVSRFLNAATILMEDRKPKAIEFLPPSELPLTRGGKGYGTSIKPEPTGGFGI